MHVITVTHVSQLFRYLFLWIYLQTEHIKIKRNVCYSKLRDDDAFYNHFELEEVLRPEINKRSEIELRIMDLTFY